MTLFVSDYAHPLAPALVTVLPHPRLRGWPKWERGGRVEVVPLDIALTRRYATDAHFTMYPAFNGRRLTSDALMRGTRPALQVVAFDLDCSEVHGTDQPAPASWRAATLERFALLDHIHPGLFFYETRGGARIVARLSPAMVISSRADARLWSQKYAIAGQYLRLRFGLICDPSCGDWTRLFRLPHATRDGQSAPEHWPIHGDASRIGVLQIEASDLDLEAAEKESKAFATARALDFAPRTIGSRGLFYHLLSDRGAILRDHQPEGSFVIRCPNERTHTTGRTGDGSTVLYRPAAGEDLGFIHCKHAHCSNLRARDWILMFDEHERDAARLAASITRAV